MSPHDWICRRLIRPTACKQRQQFILADVTQLAASRVLTDEAGRALQVNIHQERVMLIHRGGVFGINHLMAGLKKRVLSDLFTAEA